MSGNQTIRDFVDAPTSIFNSAGDYLGRLAGRVRNRVQDMGIDLDWLSQNPREADIDEDEEVWVYQYVVAYSKGALADGYAWDADVASARKGSPSPEVQFKVGIYTVGEPPESLKKRIRSVDNPRLRTLFDTDVYAGYMSGFGFERRREYVQCEQVSVREVEQKGYGLGVMWWEVEAYDEDGRLSGLADGYLNPFTREVEERKKTVGEEIPQREVWKIGKRQDHSSGKRYQISPPGRTGAKERAKAASGKTAYINGLSIGSILSEGRLRLKVAYANPNRATHHSRKQIIEQTGTPYQALSQGANLYKVGEDEDSLYFSTTKPADWSAPEPDAVSPEGIGKREITEEVTKLLMDDEEDSQFVVETDKREDLPPDGHTGRMLGLYTPVVVRDIERGTDFI